jgi:hypothetical protein
VADFNGDGIHDLVVGVPAEDLVGVVGAGVVDVVYGSESGLPDGGRQQLTQANPEHGDQFGAALATGDFDGNDADNLVIGTPGEDVGAVQDAGAVISLCGSEGLMAGCPDGVLTQAHPEPSDLYGAALTDGNFDGNELTDLAVGAPGETVGGAVAAGAADARDGNIGGLEPFLTSPLFFQGNDGVPGSPETGDLFAAALAA